MGRVLTEGCSWGLPKMGTLDRRGTGSRECSGRGLGGGRVWASEFGVRHGPGPSRPRRPALSRDAGRPGAGSGRRADAYRSVPSRVKPELSEARAIRRQSRSQLVKRRSQRHTCARRPRARMSR